MSATTESVRADALTAQELELARLIVDTLKMDLDAAQVSPTAPRRICSAASRGDLWVLTCGRRASPCSAA